jgi:hypothetical protein
MGSDGELLLLALQLVIFDVPAQLTQSFITQLAILLEQLVVLELLVVKDYFK